MDILILNWKDVKNPEAGGAEIIAFEFARRLVKEGHKVTFFSRAFNNCPNEEIVDGVKIIRRGNKFTVYIQAYFYYKNLSKKPHKVIDMINTVCWQTPLYVDKESRIGYVNQLAKEVLFYEFSWPLSLIAYLLEKFEYFTYRNTKFLCYSESTRRDLVSFGIKEKNINTFSLGVDHDRYVKIGNKNKDPLFIFVARLVKMKRTELCIRSMRKVINKYPRTSLFILGNGPDEKRLQALVYRENLTENVKFVNKNNFFIDKNVEDLKVKLMQEAWCLLLPSVKEGWGMVVTEAAACGTPSIVSDVTGLRDSVVKNKTGLILSKSPSEEELSNAMLKIIEDSNLRNKLSKESVLWAKNFNWDKSYREFRNLII